MSDRLAKDAMFDAFAEVAKALGNGRRAELVDVLAQGERHVEELAAEIGQSVANTSFHLRALATAGLVTTRRDGTRIYYRLASDRVGELWAALRDVTAAHHEQLDALAAAYLGDRSRLEQIDRHELAQRIAAGDVVVVDVRPRRRVRGRTHRRRPLDPDRPARRRHEGAPRRSRGRRLLPRPVLRVRRRRRPPPAASRPSRAPTRGRLPRMAARRPARRDRRGVVKVLVILQGPAYGDERAYNGLRLAGNLAKRDDVEVRVFCFGDAVGCAVSGQQAAQRLLPPRPDDHRRRSARRRHRPVRHVHGCPGDHRHDDLTDARRSSLDEVTDWVLSADKTITF